MAAQRNVMNTQATKNLWEGQAAGALARLHGQREREAFHNTTLLAASAKQMGQRVKIEKMGMPRREAGEALYKTKPGTLLLWLNEALRSSRGGGSNP